MKILKSHKCFDGLVQFRSHESHETSTPMSFATFMPATKLRGCVIWLSGLTCTDENFLTKAGAQRYLNENGLMAVCPDTSPRGLTLPDEHTSWDFGSGAGFYVDATTPGYRDHYRMYSYVTKELYGWIQQEHPVENRISVMGHSMGGHGALVMALREPAKFKSVSAFSPITNPTRAPWGEKAFLGYLGEDRTQWNSYDATSLVESGRRAPSVMLIDQGTNDEFLEKQLLTPNLIAACKSAEHVNVRMQAGYDHSYYFISSFIAEHVAFHAKHLADSRRS